MNEQSHLTTKKNYVKIVLNCVPRLFSCKKAEKQRKILAFSDNLKNICFTSGPNAERQLPHPPPLFPSYSVDYLDFP